MFSDLFRTTLECSTYPSQDTDGDGEDAKGEESKMPRHDGNNDGDGDAVMLAVAVANWQEKPETMLLRTHPLACAQGPVRGVLET